MQFNRKTVRFLFMDNALFLNSASNLSCTLCAKVHHVLRRNLQYLAQLEQYIKRYTDVAKLNRTDMAPIYVNQLRKLQLCKSFSLAAKHNI